MLCRSICYKSLSSIFRLLLKWQESLSIINSKRSWFDCICTLSVATSLSTDYVQSLQASSASVATQAKLTLYTSLVRSKLLYCSVVWRPLLLVDIKCLELVQRRATKFIIKGSDLDYRQSLETLHLLPLMMEFEMADILFFVKSLKHPSEYFNIQDFVQFCDQSTCSSTYFKLKHPISRNSAESNLFFNHIPRLWNSLPSLDLSLPLSSIKLKLRHIFLTNFISNFDQNNVCSYHCPCYKYSKMPVYMQFTNK